MDIELLLWKHIYKSSENYKVDKLVQMYTFIIKQSHGVQDNIYFCSNCTKSKSFQ